MTRAVSLILAMGVCSAFVDALAAQCPPAWSDRFGFGITGWDVQALAVFDDDGNGPRPPMLYAGGTFTQIGGVPVNRIAKWDGKTWSGVGGGIVSAVNGLGVECLKVLDENASGIGVPVLVAGGNFSEAGGVPVKGIAQWDGQHWSALGSGFNGPVKALEVFDDDGDGPNKPALYAGGTFSIAGEVEAMHIAKYQNGTWYPVGGGVSQYWGVYALATFDDDGDGPRPPSLFAAGDFHTAGSVSASRIAKWDGSSWSSLGSGLNSQAKCLVAHDDDGSGPHAAALYVGGTFSTAGTTQAKGIAKWDGSTWSALGSGTTSSVYSLLSIDMDEGGPNSPLLFAGGTFTSIGGVSARYVAKWDGANWSSPGNTSAFIPWGYSLAAYKDAYCAGGPSVFIGGGGNAGAIGSLGSVAQWNGDSWSSTQGAVSSEVDALATADLDGDGPDPPALYAAGAFLPYGAQGVATARWNGTCWSGLPGNFTSSSGPHSYALSTFDADGPGPNPPALFLGGPYLRLNGVSIGGLAKWNGAAWSAVADPSLSSVYALAVFDDDGDGPHLPALYVGGSFSVFPLYQTIARWDGTNFSSLGGFGPGPSIYSLTVFDDDGPGPHEPALYAGGTFSVYQEEGETIRNVAKWDGTSWYSLGANLTSSSGLTPDIKTMTAYDPGGNGSGLSKLIVAGNFIKIGTVSALNIAQWDGASWSPMGSGLNGTVYSLRVLDPDGDGPLQPMLYAGGSFNTAGGVAAARIARWDGNAWFPIESGIGGGSVLTMEVVDEDSDGPMAPALYMGGDFTTAGGVSSGRIARWSPTEDAPRWFQPPLSKSALVGQRTLFSGYAECARSIEYQWYKDGEPLSNGPRIYGATTPLMVLEGLEYSDAGNYSLMATTECGSYESAIATLTVCPADPSADINGDGKADGADIRTFVEQAFSLTPTPSSICAGDASRSGRLDSDDLVFFVNTLLANP